MKKDDKQFQWETLLKVVVFNIYDELIRCHGHFYFSEAYMSAVTPRCLRTRP